MKRDKSPSLLQAFMLGVGPAFAAVQNAVEYRLRQWIKWQRGLPSFQNESKEDLFADLSPEEQRQASEIAGRLYHDFHLQHLRANSSAENYRVNLFYLEMLERALSEAAPKMSSSVCVADIGPSEWFYVHALYAVLKWWRHSTGRAVQLTGYEADAYRVGSHLFSRYDLAHGHMMGLEGVCYSAHKFIRQPGRFDVITMLFPFVFMKDHLVWGLPVRSFNPIALLRDAWASMKPGGVLVIVNQGKQEHDDQREMLTAEKIRPAAAFQHPSLLYRYRLPRYVLAAVRDGAGPASVRF